MGTVLATAGVAGLRGGPPAPTLAAACRTGLGEPRAGTVVIARQLSLLAAAPRSRWRASSIQVPAP